MKNPARFLAKRGNKCKVVQQEEVIFFSSEDGPTKLSTKDHEFWMQPTLTDLEKRLDPTTFFRVSRAAIVNLNMMEEVAPLVGGHAATTP
jgi:two-component system LytT family response regulator